MKLSINAQHLPTTASYLLFAGAMMLSSTAAQSSSSIADNADYMTWLDFKQDAYGKSILLNNKAGDPSTALHWKLNDTHIELAVATPGAAWSGFGIAESGSMKGADIALFSAAGDGTLTDTYVLDTQGLPAKDDCQSWTLNDVTRGEGVLIFEATRLLDTGDSQDRVFFDDGDKLISPTRVIAAWGDSDQPTFHGNNFAKGNVRFFGDVSAEQEFALFRQDMEEEAEGNFMVAAEDFVIPATETTYHDFCFSKQDLLDAGVPMDMDNGAHMIGFEPYVSPDAIQYVHHFILSGSTEPWNSTRDCQEDYPGFELVYVWAPGDLPANFPSNVGSPLGFGGFQSFSLEIHYNNPGKDSGVIDNSGVRIFYTSKKREHDLGIYQTGDPFLDLEGSLVSKTGGLAQHIFQCPEGCSRVFLEEDKPITVFREQLHMHESGADMTNEQIRGGEVIRQSRAQFWDFDQQGAYTVVQKPYELRAGDSFRTTCNFKPNAGNEVFGLGSRDEMCIAFLFYYPRKVVGDNPEEAFPYVCGVGIGEFVEECEASHEVAVGITDVSQLEREFGPTAQVCNGEAVKAAISEIPDSVSADSDSGSTDGSADKPTSGTTASVMASLTILLAVVVSVIAL